MYHSLQQLEVARGLARERAQQPHASTAFRPTSRRVLRLLSTTATVVALAAPAADAVDIGQGGGGLPAISHQVAVTQHHSSPTDWTLIALAGGGTFAVIGAGLGGSQRIARRRNSTSPVRATHA